MRRLLGDALWSAGALIVLLIVLMAFDNRVRGEVAQAFSAKPVATLTDTGHDVSRITDLVIDAARDKAETHTPLMLFAFAGTVLLLFMLRT